MHSNFIRAKHTGQKKDSFFLSSHQGSITGREKMLMTDHNKKFVEEWLVSGYYL
jgi:hypothetical protein